VASVAALYDIHGNLAALEAVLAEVPADATILVGGDVVAGGPHPSETLERLRALGDRVLWLRGNADRELYPGEEGLAPPGALDATREALSEEQIEFLHKLPETQLLDDVLYCHASPRNDVDIFTERTPDERIAFLFDGLDASTVVCGHTHMQYERSVEGIRLVNAGSVGMPYADEPGAYWAFLDGSDVELRHTRCQAPDVSEWPGEWPQASADEATQHFEQMSRERY
jgi:putative phosphoesterase